MKVIFMGAPAFATPSLEALAGLGVDIAAVYTKAPRQGGRRGLAMTKTPVHLVADSLGLPVETPASLRPAEALQQLRDWEADIAVVAAYGLLLPQDALSVFDGGCFNLHASLLPRWRGAAPVQRAIMAGDKETGVSLMRMEAGLDTGAIAGEVRTRIEPTETAAELMQRLSHLAAQTLSENWRALAQGRLAFQPQREDGVEYARKIAKSEAPVDWTGSADAVKCHIHGLSPFPGATGEFRVGGQSESLKILRAVVVERSGPAGEIVDEHMTVACGEGAVRLLQVQRPGRNVVTGEEFLRAGALRIGDAFALTR